MENKTGGTMKVSKINVTTIDGEQSEYIAVEHNINEAIIAKTNEGIHVFANPFPVIKMKLMDGSSVVIPMSQIREVRAVEEEMEMAKKV